MTYKVYSKKPKKDTHTRICGHCIEEFDVKNIFIALVPPKNDYYTVYCDKCLKELSITEFKPYNKPRLKKEKINTEENIVAKKPVAKKSVAKKSDKISATIAIEKIKKITKK